MANQKKVMRSGHYRDGKWVEAHPVAVRTSAAGKTVAEFSVQGVEGDPFKTAQGDAERFQRVSEGISLAYDEGVPVMDDPTHHGVIAREGKWSCEAKPYKEGGWVVALYRANKNGHERVATRQVMKRDDGLVGVEMSELWFGVRPPRTSNIQEAEANFESSGGKVMQLRDGNTRFVHTDPNALHELRATYVSQGVPIVGNGKNRMGSFSMTVARDEDA